MEREPEYALINPIEMGKISERIGANERTILLVLIENCKNSRKWKGCVTEVTAAIRKEIMEVTGLKTRQSMYNCFSKMMKEEVIFKVDHNTYLLDPKTVIKKGGYKKSEQE